MISILFVINDFTNISLNQGVLAIASNLKAKKYKVFVYALSNQGTLYSKFNNVKGVTVQNSRNKFMGAASDIAKIIEGEEIDLVHTQTLRSDYAVILSKLLLGKTKRSYKHIGARHNYLFFYHESPLFFLKNLAYLLSCNIVDLNICAAKHLSIKLVKNLKIDPKKVKVVVNGMINDNLLQLKISKKKLRKKLGVQSDRPIIIFAGQLISRKNPLLLIRALKLIKSDYYCLILGKGSQRQIIDRYIKRHGLDKKIKLMGFAENLWEYFILADVFVLPSEGEGLSLSLLEAMAAKTTCIVSDIDANIELITNNVSGLVFDLKNKEKGLTKSLNRCLEDEGLRRQLAKNAYKKQRQYHAKQQMLRRYDEVYSRLV